MHDPIRNRGVAFSAAERDLLGLTGRLPSAVLTLEEQAARAYIQLQSEPTSLARHVYLEQLHERNETLYFRVLSDHLAELLPVVSGPTAGEAIWRYPHEHHGARGIYLSIDRPADIEKSFATLGLGPGDVDVIVCTDAEETPGIGDCGVGGIQIAAGKLAIYTICGGIRPDRVIPVSLDAGTDNEALLNDPLYLGNRHPRRRGRDYDTFIRRYIEAVSRMFPGALLHFEGFGPGNARKILQAYGPGYRVFNDDIQGTGVLMLAAVYAASRLTGIPVKHQTAVVYGADATGIAMADQLYDAIVADGATEEQAASQIWLVGTSGLIFDDMDNLRNARAAYAKSRPGATSLPRAEPAELTEIIDQAAPTVLLGTSSAPGAFTRPVIRAMCQATSRPLILPVSVPAPTIEVTAADIIAWSDGQALLAAGTAEDHRATFTNWQANTFLVFPGLALGVIVSGAGRVTPHLLQAAAAAIAEQADTSQPGTPLLPAVRNLRASSAMVAETVVHAAVADGVASYNPTNVSQAIRGAMWRPAYPDIS
jgi:malate dehydrogenase (oxaloacetate-decarboxylating)